MARTTIFGIQKSSFYQYKADALIGKRAERHGDLGTKKPGTHTFQATTTLRIVLEITANHMSLKSRTKEDGEKVVAMSFLCHFIGIAPC